MYVDCKNSSSISYKDSMDWFKIILKLFKMISFSVGNKDNNAIELIFLWAGLTIWSPDSIQTLKNFINKISSFSLKTLQLFSNNE